MGNPIESLRAGLALWRGQPLSGIEGDWAGHMREMWQQERVDAVITWARAELAHANPQPVLASLNELVRDNPERRRYEQRRVDSRDVASRIIMPYHCRVSDQLVYSVPFVQRCRASRSKISTNSRCAVFVGSRNSSPECASASRLSRKSSRMRCRRFSSSWEGRRVTRSRHTSPRPNSWPNSVAVT